MLLSPLLIGGLSGLRTFTAPAVVAWSAQLGVLRLDGALALIGSTPAVAALTVLALVELAADKWPKLPNRTTAPGLAARALAGALTGACLAAAAGGTAVLGAALGIAGAMAGAFAGFHARRAIVRRLGVPDWPVALLEDAVAVGGSAWVAFS